MFSLHSYFEHLMNPMCCGQEWPLLALLPALGMQKSCAAGAAQGLHSVALEVGSVVHDGCQLGQHPSVCPPPPPPLPPWFGPVGSPGRSWLSGPACLVFSFLCPCRALPSTHDIKHCRGHLGAEESLGQSSAHTGGPQSLQQGDAIRENRLVWKRCYRLCCKIAKALHAILCIICWNTSSFMRAMPLAKLIPKPRSHHVRQYLIRISD